MARVVLTQPWPRVGALQQRLRELGHEPLALPTSRIVDLTADRAVRDVVARLADFDWIVLVSPAAIGAAARLPDAHWPAATGIAVIGPGSLQALLDSGLPVEPGRVLLPAGPRFDAQALIATAPLRAAQGLRILVLRGEGGNDRWIEQLRARGAIVETCALYRREPIEPPETALACLRAMLERSPAPLFVFTQVDAVARLEALLARTLLAGQAHAAPALAIHARIVAALERSGWSDVRAIAPGDQALAAALELAPDSSSSHSV